MAKGDEEKHMRITYLLSVPLLGEWVISVFWLWVMS